MLDNIGLEHGNHITTLISAIRLTLYPMQITLVQTKYLLNLKFKIK